MEVVYILWCCHCISALFCVAATGQSACSAAFGLLSSLSRRLTCQAHNLSVMQPSYLLRFLCAVCLPVRAAICQHCYMSVCLSACLPTCLSLIYLLSYCLTCLPGIQRWSEARLPSFTVKCLADWKGHFSNGTALLLILCLSLDVRLIYHASSPADIRVHFDWRPHRMTPTTIIAAAALAHITCANTGNHM